MIYQNQGSGIPHRTRHSEDGIKRGFDPLLESKLKDQISKPRTLTNRAQSLDLTFSLSRITETSRLAQPDSPTTPTGNTGGNSSPTSITGPSFPSVYGPPTTQRPSSLSSQRASHALDDQTEEVSRVMSGLGL